MPLTCNIDSRGKLVRLIYGTALLLVGLVLIFLWALPAGTVLPWAVSLLLALGGAFAIFEARAGWCVLRAIGLRTPI